MRGVWRSIQIAIARRKLRALSRDRRHRHAAIKKHCHALADIAEREITIKADLAVLSTGSEDEPFAKRVEA